MDKDIDNSSAEYRGFKRKLLTAPIISLAHRNVLHVKVLEAVKEVALPGFGRGEGGVLKMVRVFDLDNEEEAYLVVHTVFASLLERVENYVGKTYELVSPGIREGKNYREIRVFELEE